MIKKKTKKKIAFVVAVPLTAQVFLMDHFEYLMKKYEIHLICNFPDHKSKKQFIDTGIICHNAPIHRSINIGADFKGMYVLLKILKREKFASVHSVTPKAGLLTALAGWMTKIPVRIHIFTGQVWATRRGLMRPILKSMDKIIDIFNTTILVDSESQRQFLIKEGVLKEKNSVVLAHGSIAGVKLERFIISSEIRKKEREKFEFAEDNIVYIFLGRLNRDKGIGQLYEAYNRLIVECPKARLLFYGIDEENYLEKVKAYKNIKLGENFFFPGLTKAPYQALQAGDVFVLPTWREGFGSSVIEAQALGLPAITSDAYGVIDATVPGITGLRCKVNDSEGLYQCMRKYYDHPSLIKEHGANGRKRVVEKFDNKVVSAAWVEYYKQLLG